MPKVKPQVQVHMLVDCEVAEFREVAAACGMTALEVAATLAVRDRPDHIIKVATVDGTVVGFLHYRLAVRGQFTVERLMVEPTHRRFGSLLGGPGVGTALVDGLKSVKPVGSHRKHCIRAFAPDTDLGAHLFLKACGFRAVRVLEGRRPADPDRYLFLCRPHEAAEAASRGEDCAGI